LVHLVPYDQIDRQAWDACIEKSQNRLIYAKSNYLDKIATGWQGIILNEYEAVMPLPVRRKWGIQYIYQPAFFQQGGIFSPLPVSKELTEKFIHTVMEHFSYAEISMNYLNEIPDIPEIEATKRSNFILTLSKTKDELTAHFSESFIRNTKKAKNAGLIYSKSENLKEAIDLYRSLYGSRIPSVKKKDYDHFEKIALDLQGNNSVIIRKVIDKTNQILAAILLLQDGNRLYNLMSSNTKKGRNAEANYFLFDSIINEFAGSGLILDLEGSDMPGIADFYLRMAPQPEPYTHIRYNHLPWLLKLFKK
jgi:hypothetical protein